MSEEKRFTVEATCGHCGNTAPMEVGAQLSQVTTHEDQLTRLSVDAGPMHELLVCPACHGVNLRRYFWNECLDPEDIEVEALWPAGEYAPIGLPPELQKEYEAALAVRRVSANAYGVLLGRLLELVCDDRGAKRGGLAKRLQELSDRGEIPGKLAEIAKSLEQMRNVAAHAWVGELTPAEVPILDSLCRAILEYVYGAPYLVEQATERLAKIRRPDRSSKSSVADGGV